MRWMPATGWWNAARTLPVAAVVPLTDLAADRRWMPDFPGVAAAENAADWDAGVPIDLKRIRDKDEAYWDAHRGTPKLFLPLAKGRELFGNRWGEFTALRVPMADSTAPAAVGARLLESLTPAAAGLVLQDVGRQGLAAAASPVDFAGLLLGMSLFLMVAAVALTAMLFRFHIEQRNRESGLLAALGIPARRLLRWRLSEGLCVVAAGSAIGALLAVAYTRGLLGIAGNDLERAGRAAPVPVSRGAGNRAHRRGGVGGPADAGDLAGHAPTVAAQRQPAAGSGHRGSRANARAAGAVVGGGTGGGRRRRAGRRPVC